MTPDLPPVSVYKKARKLGLASLLVSLTILAACSSGPADTTQSVKKSLQHTTPERKTVASVALSKVDAPYKRNMAGPQAFDSSGLAYYAYKQNGRNLPRSLDEQLQTGIPVALDEAKPGDLVFLRIDTAGKRGQLAVGILANSQVAVIALPGDKKHKGKVRRINLTDQRWSQRLVGASSVMTDK